MPETYLKRFRKGGGGEKLGRGQQKVRCRSRKAGQDLWGVDSERRMTNGGGQKQGAGSTSKTLVLYPFVRTIASITISNYYLPFLIPGITSHVLSAQFCYVSHPVVRYGGERRWSTGVRPRKAVTAVDKRHCHVSRLTLPNFLPPHPLFGGRPNIWPPQLDSRLSPLISPEEKSFAFLAAV